MVLHLTFASVIANSLYQCPQCIPSNHNFGMVQSPPCCAHSVNATLLVVTEPWLLRITPSIINNEINKQAQHDENKCNRVQPMYRFMEDLNSDNGAPKIARQQRNVHEGCAAHAEDERRNRVEDEQEDIEADYVSDDSARPRRIAKVGAIEDTGLGAVDDHSPERQHANDLVHGPLADEELLQDVAKAVEGGAQQREQVALQLVLRRELVRAREVVRHHQQADARHAREDAHDLRHLVPHVQEQERDHHHDHDRPEVDQLRGQDRRVAVA